MPTVAVFRDWLLPLSETFIRGQVDVLSKFQGVYVGCRRLSGLTISRNPVVLMHPGLLGRAEKVLLRTTGLAPSLISGLRKYHPVLLHAHFGQDGALAMPLSKELKIPLIVTFHGHDACWTDETFRENPSGRWYLKQRERLNVAATRILADSAFLAKKLFDQRFSREKVQVHYIGVNTEKFKPQFQVPRERKVLFVGRLVEKKGCEYLIRAMEPVQKAMPEVELVIIGDGPLRGSLEQLAKSLLRRFTFTGAQPAEGIRGWMRRAAVLCVPSIVAKSGDAEGLPTVVLEGQASALPVVAFDSAGIPEAVRHGESGYLAAERDWRALSEYISKLLGDPDLWASFSRAGRALVKSEFDVKIQTAKLERIYEEVIDSHSRRIKHSESN